MTYTLQIRGLDIIKQRLGASFAPILDNALMAVAYQIMREIKPYPPATIANSSSNPTRHWYQRGYGPRWITKRGETKGRKTSQNLSKRWIVYQKTSGRWVVANSATYAGVVHSEEKQAHWHRERGWRTDKFGIERVVSSQAVQRIFHMAFSRFFRI